MAKIDIILITTGSRPELLRQSINSIWENSTNRVEGIKNQTLTVVVDGYGARNGSIVDTYTLDDLLHSVDYLIVNEESQGASASRNIGVSSIPKYRRGDFVCFFDDDVYCVKGWDENLLNCYARSYGTITTHRPGSISEGWARERKNRIVSGHGHPYNGAEQRDGWSEPLVISTVNMLMPWSLWDDVGYFQEPGGAGGSEDFDYCQRANKKGYGFAVTEPQCVIHAGLTSTTGKQIVGYEQMVKQNEELIQLHGLEGVIWK